MAPFFLLCLYILTSPELRHGYIWGINKTITLPHPLCRCLSGGGERKEKEEWQDFKASVPCCQQKQLVLSIDGGRTGGDREAGSVETQGSQGQEQPCFRPRAQCHLRWVEESSCPRPLSPRPCGAPWPPGQGWVLPATLCVVGSCAPGVKVKT